MRLLKNVLNYIQCKTLQSLVLEKYGYSNTGGLLKHLMSVPMLVIAMQGHLHSRFCQMFDKPLSIQT